MEKRVNIMLVRKMTDTWLIVDKFELKVSVMLETLPR